MRWQKRILICIVSMTTVAGMLMVISYAAPMVTTFRISEGRWIHVGVVDGRVCFVQETNAPTEFDADWRKRFARDNLIRKMKNARGGNIVSTPMYLSSNGEVGHYYEANYSFVDVLLLGIVASAAWGICLLPAVRSYLWKSQSTDAPLNRFRRTLRFFRAVSLVLLLAFWWIIPVFGFVSRYPFARTINLPLGIHVTVGTGPFCLFAIILDGGRVLELQVNKQTTFNTFAGSQKSSVCLAYYRELELESSFEENKWNFGPFEVVRATNPNSWPIGAEGWHSFGAQSQFATHLMSYLSLFERVIFTGNRPVYVSAAFCPLWFFYSLAALVWILPMVLLVRGPMRRNRRRELNQCIFCGYDLTGLIEPRCPECGKPINKKSQPDSPSQIE